MKCNRAVEVARLGEILGRPQQHRGVAVMAAGVHHARMPARVLEGVALGDRQRVHVGADAHGALRGAVAQRADQAGGGQAPRHLDAPAFRACWPPRRWSGSPAARSRGGRAGPRPPLRVSSSAVAAMRLMTGMGGTPTGKVASRLPPPWPWPQGERRRNPIPRRRRRRAARPRISAFSRRPRADRGAVDGQQHRAHSIPQNSRPATRSSTNSIIGLSSVAKMRLRPAAMRLVQRRVAGAEVAGGGEELVRGARRLGRRDVRVHVQHRRTLVAPRPASRRRSAS